METTAKKSTTKYWLWFFVWTAIMVVTYIFAGGYASMILPFVVTYFALALNLM